MSSLRTPSNFHAAKPVIRKALDEADRETLLSLLEAARAGNVPYHGAIVSRDIAVCGCLAERLLGRAFLLNGGSEEAISAAYGTLVPHSELSWVEEQPYDKVRQRVLVPMVKAALKRKQVGR